MGRCTQSQTRLSHRLALQVPDYLPLFERTVLRRWRLRYRLLCRGLLVLTRLTDRSGDESDCYPEVLEAGHFVFDPLAISSSEDDVIVPNDVGDLANKNTRSREWIVLAADGAQPSRATLRFHACHRVCDSWQPKQ